MRALEHQTQPTATSCQCTCMAIIAGMAAEKVINNFHDLYKDGALKPVDWFKERGIRAEHLPSYKQMKWDSLYIVTVPSLNLEAELHSIVIDCRDWEKGEIIFDPNKGKEGKKYYVIRDEDADSELAVTIKGYHIDTEVFID